MTKQQYLKVIKLVIESPRREEQKSSVLEQAFLEYVIDTNKEIVKRLEKKIDNKLYNPNWNAGIIASISVVESVGGITMSEQYRTKQEYTENYANVYCNGDQEEAAGHAIVKEVCKNLESE